MKILLENIKVFIKYYPSPANKLYLRGVYIKDFIHFIKQYFSYHFFYFLNYLKVKNKHYYSEKGSVAEDEVAKLTSNLYFKDFCYLRPMNESKEIADLLVIFDDTVLIFSIKNIKMKYEECEFFTEINIPKKFLEKSKKQLHGAERFLRKQDNFMLTNMDGEEHFLDFSTIKTYYKIAINISLIDPVRMFVPVPKEDILFLSKKDFHFLLKYVSTVPELISLLQYRMSPPQPQEYSCILLLGTFRDFISTWCERILYEIDKNKGQNDLIIADFSGYEKLFLKRNKKLIDKVNKKVICLIEILNTCLKKRF